MTDRSTIINDMRSTLDVGREFVVALAARDFERLGACLAPEMDFHAVVPSDNPFRERATGPETAELIGRWFGEADPLDLLSSSVEELADCVRIAYRFAALEDGIWHLVEQQAYARVEGGKIAKLDLVCSGFQPVPERPR